MRAPEDLHDDGMWMQLEEMGERPDLLTDPFLDDEMLECTVDGYEVEVAAGSTVLQACESIGVEIPTLCTDTRLKPYGACRMCVVEVQPGPPRPTASKPLVAT